MVQPCSARFYASYNFDDFIMYDKAPRKFYWVVTGGPGRGIYSLQAVADKAMLPCGSNRHRHPTINNAQLEWTKYCKCCYDRMHELIPDVLSNDFNEEIVPDSEEDGDGTSLPPASRFASKIVGQMQKESPGEGDVDLPLFREDTPPLPLFRDDIPLLTQCCSPSPPPPKAMVPAAPHTPCRHVPTPPAAHSHARVVPPVSHASHTSPPPKPVLLLDSPSVTSASSLSASMVSSRGNISYRHAVQACHCFAKPLKNGGSTASSASRVNPSKPVASASSISTAQVQGRGFACGVASTSRGPGKVSGLAADSSSLCGPSTASTVGEYFLNASMSTMAFKAMGINNDIKILASFKSLMKEVKKALNVAEDITEDVEMEE
ncbi:hypothetical protein DFH09DRAFT_1307911 [Mycena vulgaris]|nr:hypothetical protein DFH09DRAFT_1307911 [Mycena vulgaris]